jgi:hypothetical protein
MAALPGMVINAELGSLAGETVKVSYPLGDSSWSDPVSSPLGVQQMFVFRVAQSHAQPGEHTIAFRFDDGTAHVDEQELHYKVNSPPELQMMKSVPLVFNEVPTGPVTLPIAVSDANGD